jgi:hypothetical protein
MSKVKLIRLAKRIRQKINILAGFEHTPYISYSRRINRVKTNERVCAMTFDDGPMNSPASPSNSDKPLTLILLETLEKHNAYGTFDVIGDTSENYPDNEGKLGTPSWGGVSYDHYPSFACDSNAGAFNCPNLIDRIISGGHQITNHTYKHILYSKKNIIYSRRKTLSSFELAEQDLLKLDRFILENHSYKMDFSRPPHYVDRIEKRLNAYDLYSINGYNYLGASFDGAGWLPCSSYEQEKSAMTEPLEKVLKNNPDALCGQIIFQKDGYNMAMRTPVAESLDMQLTILERYGYRVITVEQLFNEHPFSDIDELDDDFELFCELSKKYAIAYTDNTLHPDNPMTLGELCVLVAPKEETVNNRINALLQGNKRMASLSSRHPYSGAVCWAFKNGLISKSDKKTITRNLTLTDLEMFSEYINIEQLSDSKLTRRNIFKALKNKY